MRTLSIRSAPLRRLSCVALIALSVSACNTCPPLPDPVPPPRRPLDAKTQLEYGGPPPAARY